MKLPCRRWAERITRELDGELDSVASRALHEHLERCAACRRRWEEASAASTARRGLWRDVAEADDPAQAARVATDAWRRREAGSARPARLWGRWVPADWVTVGALAASLALVLWCASSWRTVRGWSRWPASSPVYTLCDLAARESAREAPHDPIVPPSGPSGVADQPGRD